MRETIEYWLQTTLGLMKPVIALAVIAGLGIWFFSDGPKQVGPKPAASRLVLILLHGYGAPGDDLVSLAKRLSSIAPDVCFIIPPGPHRSGTGRTWIPSFTAESKEALDQQMHQYRAQARQVVMDIVADLETDGVPPGQIYVGGFSQGGAVATDVFVSEPDASRLGGLVSLSAGGLKTDIEPLLKREPMRAFFSHGSRDPVTGFRDTRNKVSALKEAGHDVVHLEFPGGHVIPPEVVESLGAFLAAP